MARPCLLTPEVTAKVVAFILEGAFAGVAAQAAGISTRTFFRWMQQGGEDPEGPFGDFYLRVIEAEAKHEAELSSLINKAAKSDWRAAQALAQARYPERWTAKQRTEVTGANGGPIALTDARQQLADRLARLSANVEVVEPPVDGDGRGDPGGPRGELSVEAVGEAGATPSE